ncbi:MAG: M14 family metallocarboxypeptidase [Candidatus Paceibacterota bacterium]|jgi:hypothetical protein
MLKKSGKNKNCYEGESIDIECALSECLSHAKKFRFEIESLPVESLELIALKKIRKNAKRRIYISAGIHGDEPAGPLALQELLKENEWPKDASLWIFPCLNPSGFLAKTRESGTKDLNRDYLHLETPEIRAHTEWLQKEPDFDLTLCLHEDWEAKGFYLYEAKKETHPSLAEEIIEEVKKIFPIDRSRQIDGYPAKAGVIRSFCDCDSFEFWPEAIYLCQKKQSLNYTLETSSDFPLESRVKALVAAIKAAIK